MTRTGVLVGTLDYTAPERIEGGRGDASSDIYAFGCMLFEMVTGHVPFDREGDVPKMWAHLNEPVPSARSEFAEVPPGLDAIIARGRWRRSRPIASSRPGNWPRHSDERWTRCRPARRSLVNGSSGQISWTRRPLQRRGRPSRSRRRANEAPATLTAQTEPAAASPGAATEQPSTEPASAPPATRSQDADAARRSPTGEASAPRAPARRPDRGRDRRAGRRRGDRDPGHQRRFEPEQHRHLDRGSDIAAGKRPRGGAIDRRPHAGQRDRRRHPARRARVRGRGPVGVTAGSQRDRSRRPRDHARPDVPARERSGTDRERRREAVGGRPLRAPGDAGRPPARAGSGQAPRCPGWPTGSRSIPAMDPPGSHR